MQQNFIFIIQVIIIMFYLTCIINQLFFLNVLICRINDFTYLIALFLIIIYHLSKTLINDKNDE